MVLMYLYWVELDYSHNVVPVTYPERVRIVAAVYCLTYQIELGIQHRTRQKLLDEKK